MISREICHTDYSYLVLHRFGAMTSAAPISHTSHMNNLSALYNGNIVEAVPHAESARKAYLYLGLYLDEHSLSSRTTKRSWDS